MGSEDALDYDPRRQRFLQKRINIPPQALTYSISMVEKLSHTSPQQPSSADNQCHQLAHICQAINGVDVILSNHPLETKREDQQGSPPTGYVKLNAGNLALRCPTPGPPMVAAHGGFIVFGDAAGGGGSGSSSASPHTPCRVGVCGLGSILD